MHRQLLETWVSSFVTAKKQRDDIHVDQIDRAYADKDQWLRGATEILIAARDVRNVKKSICSFAVEFYLSPMPNKAAPKLTTAAELTAQFSWTPPMLVAYASGHEPWIRSPAAFSRRDAPLAGHRV